MNETTRHHRHAGPYTLPSGMSIPEGQDLPLYLLVAHWALVQGRPVTVRDISEAFHIINRRASDIMLYLRRLPDSVLTCRSVRVYPDGALRRSAVLVTSVSGLPAPDAPQKNNTPQRPPARKSTAIRDLRTWMVSRRPGEATPASLLTHTTGEKH
ncbi:CaiF/GrlA family transcriptional regulator [Salmonella enterica subsp. enterica serovar Vitkin]|nr:CaiF/GrlA family transcriptional regulator [Salmonella enterica subsp. enterica serovar Vitkin]